jgi:uncharacterized C2H2 Zn-finger protein
VNDEYNCGMCGGVFPNRDAYIEHLIKEHPLSWLAKRAKWETERREKKQRGTSK